VTETGGRAKKFFSSVEWLVRADIAVMSTNVSKIDYDLKDYEIGGNFRLYTADLSLLVAMRDFSLKQKIVENTLEGNTKGGLYECAVADVLLKKEYELHFYRNESLKRELEFVIQKGGEVVPIEVKSGRGKSTTLNQIMKNNSKIKIAYKLMDGNVGEENGVLSVPLYMAMFLWEEVAGSCNL